MRHCVNESVEVFEATHENLAVLLAEVSDEVGKAGDGYWWSLDVHSDVNPDTGRMRYIALGYRHE